jgi:hypothetical protein
MSQHRHRYRYHDAMMRRSIVHFSFECHVHRSLVRLSKGPASRYKILCANLTATRPGNAVVDIMMDKGLIEYTGEFSKIRHMPTYQITVKGQKLLELLDAQAAMVGQKIA